MSFFLSPIGNEQQFNANGDPLNAGRILTYLAGSTTPTATYTDNTGATQQANPIILNSLGLPASPIWLNGGITYKFVIQDANSVTLRTVDNISGINDTTATQTEWVSSGLVPTFISATSFSVPGDQTGVLQIGRRLRTQNTAGLIYSRITNSVFAATITTVTVVNDSGALDSGLSSVAYGLLAPTNQSIPSILTGITQVNGTNLLHVNDIVNGDFRIAQAGTSFAAPVGGAYDLDGWFNGATSSAVFTVAQVAGSTTGRLARQVTITTADAAVAAGDYVADATKIEGYNIEKYIGNTFTIAGRAKVPVAGIHCVSLRNSTADRSYVKEINFPTANVWQDFSFTVVGGLPTAGTWNYTNGVGLDIWFNHMCGTTFQTTPDAWRTGSFLGTANQVNDCATNGNVWALEKVTMNLGTVAAVSEISFEQELVRCQRYFYRVTKPSMQGVCSAATLVDRVGMSHPVVMRATPTGAIFGTLDIYDGTAVGTVTATTLMSLTTSGFDFNASLATGTFTAGRPAIVFISSNTGGFDLSARL